MIVGEVGLVVEVCGVPCLEELLYDGSEFAHEGQVGVVVHADCLGDCYVFLDGGAVGVNGVVAVEVSVIVDRDALDCRLQVGEGEAHAVDGCLSASQVHLGQQEVQLNRGVIVEDLDYAVLLLEQAGGVGAR